MANTRTAARAVPARTTRAYTDRERAEALCLLRANGGNVKRTARELSLPRKTVCTWARGRGVTEEAKRMSEDPKVRGELADKFKGKANQALDAITPEKLAQASAKDLALVAGISTDKAQLLAGEPTSITADARGRLAAEEALERLLRIAREQRPETTRAEVRAYLISQKPELAAVLPGGQAEGLGDHHDRAGEGEDS